MVTGRTFGVSTMTPWRASCERIMNPIDAHGRLDALGLLNDAHAEGTYALEVETPNNVESVQRTWLDAIGAPLPDEYAEQLADAETCLYVGRSGDVYDRLIDHARGDVRRASFIRAFGVTDIHGVYPEDENNGVAERDRARALSDADTVVWTDGELF